MKHRKRITQRELFIKRGTEGPRHDPYAFTRYGVVLNGRSIVLHMGLGVSLTVDGRQIKAPKRLKAFKWNPTTGRHVDEVEAWTVQRFEQLTGIAANRFERYYERLNPYCYCSDPMGHPSDYE